nr:hypothetical protein [Anaerolineae bacterium]
MTRALRPPVAVIHYYVMKAFLRSPTRPAVASALLALALTALLYGDALRLPLFSDDLVQIPWLESISWHELWSSPSPYGYYRPLWYTLWRLWGGLVGGLHPPGLHFLNLVVHFAAAWLAGLLTAAWIRPGAGEPCPYIPACLATALFAAFPFSRQAVAWPGALYNPLVSAMAAGALLAYDRGRQGHGKWIGLALLLAALAPFTYEAGLLVGPLVVLTEGVGWLQRRWKRRSWWPMAFVGLFLATLVTWRAMRGTGVTGFGLTPPDLRRNAGYLVQGLIYPTAPLAQWLAVRWDLDPEPTLWLIALPTLALLAWSGLRWNRGMFWLGAGWFALFALPPVVSMEADWFALAPRFLYMTAAGVSLVWTAATSSWMARLRPSRRAVVSGGVLVALLTPAAVFVRDGIRLYGMAGESIWDAAGAATREQPLLLVNLPMRITPRSRLYPLGFEGITPLPARVTAEGLVYVHTGIHDAAKAVAFGIVAVDDPPGYTYQLFGRLVGWEELAVTIRQARAVYLTRYEPERIRLVEAGGHPSPGRERVGEGMLARFGDPVALLDATCTCDEAGQVHLTTYWRAEADVEADVTVFAHLLDPYGALVAQADGYPLLGMLPFWLWEPGEAVRDVRHFAPVPAGEYTVRLGMWELTTGKRWQATDGQGTSLSDDVVLLPINCP